MTKEKKSQASLASKAEGDSTGSVSPSLSPTPSPTQAKADEGSASANGPRDKQSESSTSALVISRNKHWRYISSFHGPWLQLPPEVLESLAYSNYSSPRPLPIDPAVFFDLVKIRHLIEEATDLAVRAANGTTSSSLNNSLNATNGLLSGGSSSVLGFGLGGGSGNAKLSRERRHRMREHATQKLARAYRLDEVAASVATMQSASALEEVAKLVLQRNQHDSDAKYVHFFHEKIPSRSLAQSTGFEPLDEVIASRPREGSIYRTRAATSIFKDDYAAAARDLTEGLGVHRLYSAQHGEGRRAELQLASEAKRRMPLPRDLKFDLRSDEADQPSGLETQLLFHRGGVYLSLACQHIHSALDALRLWQNEENSKGVNGTEKQDNVTPTLSLAGKEARRRWLEARKAVKTNARRAIRDYINFISHFEYSPGLPREAADEFIRTINAASGNFNGSSSSNNNNNNNNNRGVLAQSRRLPDPGIQDLPQANGPELMGGNYATQIMETNDVYQLDTLFSAQPPSNLPPFPREAQALVATGRRGQGQSGPGPAAAGHQTVVHDCYEAVTYHPLLTDALHSLLLCHALAQTSKKELLRHAHMVARLARVCDGYPIFLAPRSPSRADWIEVLYRADNWIELKQPWEALCTPAPLPSAHPERERRDRPEDEGRRQRRQEAILEALADDRVQDEESFRSAIRAREQRAQQHQQSNPPPIPPPPPRSENSGSSAGAGPLPKRWAQEDGKEYPICTERADAIGRWIREAPISTGEGKGKSKKGGAGGGGGGKKRAGKSPNLEDSFHDMNVNGEAETVD